ncbi:unnamed protein product [Ilex paraguariensis]|uniref:Uncharacterized protein n=1 Tax=Ilex paraguariensis TaxID=185542 RepID=A0ABC8R7P9_9AQUA
MREMNSTVEELQTQQARWIEELEMFQNLLVSFQIPGNRPPPGNSLSLSLVTVFFQYDSVFSLYSSLSARHDWTYEWRE